MTAPPDLALVRVAGGLRGGGHKRTAVAAARMCEATRPLDIPDVAVTTTTSYSVGPEHDDSERGRDLVRYRADHGYAMEVDVERVGEDIDVAVGSGPSQIQDVSFMGTDETCRELRAEALAAAMRTDRSDADTIALAAGRIMMLSCLGRCSSTRDYRNTPVGETSPSLFERFMLSPDILGV